MVAPNDAEIRIYNKAFGFENVLPDFESFYFNPRKNGQGHAEIVLPSDSDRNKLMRTPGTRLVCMFRGELMMSGQVRTQQGAFIAKNGGSVYALQSDWRLLENTRAWVDPGASLYPTALNDIAQAWPTGAQNPGTVANQSGYYRWPTGINTAEAAIKHIIQVNAVTRLGRNMTILPNQNRGGNARAAGMLPEVRMNTLAEIVQKLTDWSGLVVDIWQDFDTPTVFVDVHQPDTYSQTLTPSSGIVTGGDWSRRTPEATRVIVGGPGEDAARAFYQVLDTTGLENEYGDIIEVFRDATGSAGKWPEGLANEFQVPKYYLTRGDVPQADRNEFLKYLIDAGKEALAEGRPLSSLDVELVETESLQLYGSNGLHIGDWINAESDGVEIAGQIDEADISLTEDEGQTVTPVIGQRTDDDDTALWDAISGLDKAIRNMTRKR